MKVNQKDTGVIIQNDTLLYNEPLENAEILVRLNDATELVILSETEYFYEVNIAEQRKGWIKKENIIIVESLF